ncbi:hypothetical protein CQW23_33293 [Capsicum baccatum]|uniref:Uncharacterized protein n=1 Tax=Capsicum baccatum TaxID=33114 RepID=A0A2G2V294_CAPBA|nr:hypothetical protein CQW23_33293 [Capsicum baccatum]
MSHQRLHTLRNLLYYIPQSRRNDFGRLELDLEELYFVEVVVFSLVELGRKGLDLVEELDTQVVLAELEKFGNGLFYWSLGFDYSVHEDRVIQFYLAIRKYYPGLKDGSLEPGYAGIRPKIFGPEEGPTDFVVQGEETHGISSLVNLFGIESPGLTFSMAITEHIVAKLLK